MITLCHDRCGFGGGKNPWESCIAVSIHGGDGPISSQPSFLSCRGGRQFESLPVLGKSCLCVLLLPVAGIRCL